MPSRYVIPPADFDAVVDAATARFVAPPGVRDPLRPRGREVHELFWSSEFDLRRALEKDPTLANDLARERWERLATHGIIPAAWIDDPMRVFHGERRTRLDDGAVRYAPQQPFAHPALPADVLVFGSDVQAVILVEALAHEARQRRGLPPSQRPVRWFVDGTQPEPLPVFERERALDALYRSGRSGRSAMLVHRATSLLDRLEPGLRRDVGTTRPWTLRALMLALYESLWNLAATRGLVPRATTSPEGDVRAVGFEGPNPFTPLVDLYRAGYACGSLVRDLELHAMPW